VAGGIRARVIFGGGTAILLILWEVRTNLESCFEIFYLTLPLHNSSCKTAEKFHY